VDTAEWAHERADVRPHIKHALAPAYDSRPGIVDPKRPPPCGGYMTR